MNLTAEDLASGVLRDRVKVGASLADVDPMNLDSSVSRNTNKHQKAVKQQLLLKLWMLKLFVFSPGEIWQCGWPQYSHSVTEGDGSVPIALPWDLWEV